MSMPSMILAFMGKSAGSGVGGTIVGMLSQNNWFNFKTPIYTVGYVLYAVMIVFFAYFYTSITFNPIEVADNMKKQGGFVPGIRPGKPTQDYHFPWSNRSSDRCDDSDFLQRSFRSIGFLRWNLADHYCRCYS